MKTITTAQKGISLDLNFRKAVTVAILFGLLFVLPVYLHEQSLHPSITSEPTVKETYTANALNQGKVAGAQTSIIDQGRYLNIFNNKIDLYIQDSNSLSFVIGGVLLLGGAIISIFLIKEYSPKKNY